MRETATREMAVNEIEHRGPNWWRTALAAFVGLASAVAILFAAVPAEAHSGDQSYLYLDVGQTTMEGRVEAPIADLAEVLGLTFEGGDDEVAAQLEANEAAIHGYLNSHLTLGVDGIDWFIDYETPSLFFSDAPELDDNYTVIPFVVNVAGDVPREFDVTFSPFFGEVDGRNSHLLLIENDWAAGVIENGYETLITFTTSQPQATADLGDPSALANLWSSMKLGIDHIQTGPDHVLFILVLLLPSVLVWRGSRWEPTDSFGSSLWRILKIVTMFTIAHSITFTLAGFGLLPLPSPRIVESIIALSIAAAALNNLRPIIENKEWLISFVFGLWHGMGFASLVSGLDVSRSTQAVSLLGRNIGIEIGQAVVVLVLFPLLFLLRRLSVYRPLFVGLSLFLIVVAVGWGIERAFEVDFGTDRLVDPLFVYPGVFVAVAGLTAVAAAAYMAANNAGKLLPTASAAAGALHDSVDGDGPGEDPVREEVRV